jgi:hypothetical protein
MFFLVSDRHVVHVVQVKPTHVSSLPFALVKASPMLRPSAVPYTHCQED